MYRIIMKRPAILLNDQKNIGPNKGDKKDAVRFVVCSMHVHKWAHSPPSEN